ncbi:hypothetical protein HN371_00635 [Candidatus Poribacteria bacterium]|nr:hypothetical protein [Candidatus Poribacteria bacterium]
MAGHVVCIAVVITAMTAFSAVTNARPAHDLTPVQDSAKHVHMQLTTELRAHLKQATRQVLCACGGCPPVLLDDCICATARDLKDELATQMLAGRSVDAMVAAYVAEYGSEHRAAPTKEGFNLLIWIFPAIATLGLGALFWARATLLARPRDERAQPDDALLAEYGHRIEGELSRRGKP